MKPDVLIKHMVSIVDAIDNGNPNHEKIQKNLARGIKVLAEIAKDQQGHIDRVSKLAADAMVKSTRASGGDFSSMFGGPR